MKKNKVFNIYLNDINNENNNIFSKLKVLDKRDLSIKTNLDKIEAFVYEEKLNELDKEKIIELFSYYVEQTQHIMQIKNEKTLITKKLNENFQKIIEYKIKNKEK